jgi:hypothetical protein
LFKRFFEIRDFVVRIGIERHPQRSDEVEVVFITQRRVVFSAFRRRGHSEAEDGPVGVDKSQEIICPVLEELNPGDFLVQINNPAQLVGLGCVRSELQASRGVLTSWRQPE